MTPCYPLRQEMLQADFCGFKRLHETCYLSLAFFARHQGRLNLFK
jgi:hypothetical protein